MTADFNPYRRVFSFAEPPDRASEVGNWIVIDTETGGINPEQYALLSMAFYSPDMDEPVHFLISDSPGTISREAAKINGLSWKKVRAEGITIAEARERFEQLTAGKAIVCQNGSFDLGFIAGKLYDAWPECSDAPRASNRRLEAFCESHVFYDTWAIFRRLHREAPSAKLAAIAEFYGLDFDEDELHDAAADAVLTAAVFKAELSEIERFRAAARPERAEIERQYEEFKVAEASKEAFGDDIALKIGFTIGGLIIAAFFIWIFARKL